MSDAFDLHKAIRKFTLGEGITKEPSMMSYLQTLEEVVSNVSPRNQADARRLEMALEAIRGTRRHYKRLKEENAKLMEQNSSLEEQLKVLEENKNNEE